MIIGEDYKFRDDMKHDTVPIELLTGPYKGVIFRYTDVGIMEQNDETAKMRFNYDLHGMGDYTETSLRKDPKFTQHIGIILNGLILEIVENDGNVLKEDDDG